MLKSVLSVAAFAAMTSAHFTLDFPQTRGFDENKEPEFCGGFNQNATRSPFPLTGGFFTITSAHSTANTIALVSFNNTPTALTDFSATPLQNFFSTSKEGPYCIPVGFGAFPNAKNGTNATIQIQYDGGDGNLYQCADVVLVDNFKIPSSVKCTNASSVVVVPTSSGAAGPSGSAGAPAASGTTKPNGASQNVAAIAGAGFAVLGALAGLAL